ncbi:MAG: hypothetical protein JMJ93_01125 [Synergistaceae bacterium]|nr:hypothetical protein [Synergistaceae bacterium]
MKKATVVLAALAVLLAGLVLLQRLQENLPEPQAFMTRSLAGDVELSLRFADGKELSERIAPVLEALAETMEGDDPLPSLLVLRFSDLLAQSGPGVFRVAASPDGSSRLEGALAVKARNPESYLRDFLLHIAAAHAGLALESVPDEPDGPLRSLGRLKNERTGATLYLALWEGRAGDALLLAASDVDVLEAMVQAKQEEAIRHAFIEPLEGAAEIVLSVDPSLVEEGGLFKDRPWPEGRRLLLSAHLRDDDDGALRLKSNAWDLLSDAEEKASLRPLGRSLPLVGSDPVLVVTGRLQDVDVAALGALLPLREDRLLEDLADPLVLGEEERRALFDGPLTFVIAGRALSPLGETPGLYVLLGPLRPGLAPSLLERIVALPMPIPFSPVPSGPWQAHSLPAFADVTVAAREEALLLGLLSPSELEVEAGSGPYDDLFDPAGYGGIYLSLTRLDGALRPLLWRLAPLNGRFREGAELLETLSRRIDAVSLRILSPGEALLRIDGRKEVR